MVDELLLGVLDCVLTFFLFGAFGVALGDAMVRLGNATLEEKEVDSLLNEKKVLRSTLGWKVDGGMVSVLLAGFLGVDAASF